MTSDCDGSSSPSGITIFKGTHYSPFTTLTMLTIWLGGIHLIVLLVIASLLLFPSPLSLSILSILLFLMLIPRDSAGKFGHKLCRSICKYACGYFPIHLHVEDISSFDTNRAYVFGFEPHSVLPIGVVALANYTGFMPLQKIKVLASTAVFYTPFIRQIWTWLGLIPATRATFVSHLAAGYSCVVVPGGVQEIIYMQSNAEVVVLEPRKGFICVAMEMGCPLVPIFCFGQSRVYKWWKPDGKWYTMISRAIKFTPIVFWGRYFSPVPFQHPLHVVVGKPIHVKQTNHPTAQEVAEVHSKFVSALRELFEKHKIRVGCQCLQLTIL